MTASKRLAISAASVLSAQFIVGATLSAYDGPELFWERVFGFMYFSTMFTIPGWLIALPVVVRPPKIIAGDWRRIALVGILIGPITMLLIDALFAIYTHSTGAALEWVLKYCGLATVVSSMTSGFYLTGLHVASRKPHPSPK